MGTISDIAIIGGIAVLGGVLVYELVTRKPTLQGSLTTTTTETPIIPTTTGGAAPLNTIPYGTGNNTSLSALQAQAQASTLLSQAAQKVIAQQTAAGTLKQGEAQKAQALSEVAAIQTSYASQAAAAIAQGQTPQPEQTPQSVAQEQATFNKQPLLTEAQYKALGGKNWANSGIGQSPTQWI